MGAELRGGWAWPRFKPDKRSGLQSIFLLFWCINIRTYCGNKQMIRLFSTSQQCYHDCRIVAIAHVTSIHDNNTQFTCMAINTLMKAINSPNLVIRTIVLPYPWVFRLLSFPIMWNLCRFHSHDNDTNFPLEWRRNIILLYTHKMDKRTYDLIAAYENYNDITT